MTDDGLAEIRNRHEDFEARYSPGPDWEPMNQTHRDRGYLLAQYQRLKDAVNQWSSDCLSSCDSLAHDENCPTISTARWLIDQQAKIAAQAAELARLTHQRDDASVRGGELATRITELQGLTFQQGQEIARLGEVVGGYRIDVLLRQMRALEREQAEDRAALKDAAAIIPTPGSVLTMGWHETHAAAIARAAVREGEK